MKIQKPHIIAIAVGTAAGIVTQVAFMRAAWYDLLIWAAVGLALGLSIKEKATVRESGVLYGFFLTVSFLVFGFRGRQDQVLGFLLMTVVCEIVGSLCGWFWVAVGRWLRVKFFCLQCKE